MKSLRLIALGRTERRVEPPHSTMEDGEEDAAAHPTTSLRFEDFLDGAFEKPRDFEREREARIIFLRLDRIDRLTRYAEFFRQIPLRPFPGRAQFAQLIFHR